MCVCMCVCVCVCVDGVGVCTHVFHKKEKKNVQRVKLQRQVVEGNSNGICDKVTFRGISAPSYADLKVLS